MVGFRDQSNLPVVSWNDRHGGFGDMWKDEREREREKAVRREIISRTGKFVAEGVHCQSVPKFQLMGLGGGSWR